MNFWKKLFGPKSWLKVSSAPEQSNERSRKLEPTAEKNRQTRTRPSQAKRRQETKGPLKDGSSMDEGLQDQIAVALHEAIDSNNLKAVRMLLARHPDFIPGESGDTPLRQPARYANLEIVGASLQAKANVNARDSLKNTALHEVGSYDVPGVAQRASSVGLLLLKHGADIHARNNLGMTPLHYAAGSGNVQWVETLLEKGANVHAKKNRGETPLQYICGGAGNDGINPRLDAARAVLRRHGAR